MRDRRQSSTNPFCFSRRQLTRGLAGLVVIGALGGTFLIPQQVRAASLPDPVMDVPATGQQMVVLAGGCF